MLYKELPFIRFTVPLITGIIVASYCQCKNLWPFFTGALLLLAAGFILDVLYNKTVLLGSSLWIFFFCTGLVIYSCRYNKLLSSQIEPGNHYLRVEKYPVGREKTVKVAASVLQEENSRFTVIARIMVYFPLNSRISETKPGDIISCEINPRIISNFSPGDSFDYAHYMMMNGYRYFSFAAGRYTDCGSKKNLRHLSLALQRSLYQKYKLSISNSRSLSVVAALTLGYREQLDEEIRSRFNDAGISHIMAVSGLHVGIISSLVIGFLRFLRIRSGLLVFLLSLTAIWCFTIISGLSPSASRASIMFSFLYAGKFSGRDVNPVNTLLASAFIMLMFNPFMLHSPGFRLSYSAVLTILLFYRKVNSLLNFKGLFMKNIWSMTSVTLLAQAGTFPFVATYFRSFPVFSIFSNLLAVPLATLILVSGFLFLALPAGFPVVKIIADLIEFETMLLCTIADTISSLPGSVIKF